MTPRRALWLIAVVAVLAVAFYLWGWSHTPNGQPALVSLDTRNEATFQQSFDAAAADARLVFLLSPT